MEKRREDSITRDELATCLTLIDSHNITYHSHEGLLNVAIPGAVETGRALYDWIYLSLALSLSCRFITADRKFFMAMRGTRFRYNLVWVESIPNLIDNT